MRISATSGSIFNGLAIIGTGAAVSFPDQKVIGFCIIRAAHKYEWPPCSGLPTRDQ